MSQNKLVPTYRKHQKPGRRPQGYVDIDGQRRYFPGEFNSNESVKAYERWAAEWLGRDKAAAPSADVTVVELVSRYLAWAKQYYIKGGHYDYIRASVRPLLELYSDLPAKEISPLKIKAVQQKWIANQHCRTSCNAMLVRLRHIFKWGTEQELVSAEVWHSLQAVAPLKYGKTTAEESEPVLPVPAASIETIKPFVNKSVRALIDLQLLTGARPGELLKMRYGDIDRSDSNLWVYRLADHKTKYRGHSRSIYLGPQCQAIIMDMVAVRTLGDYLFKPSDHWAERSEIARGHRRPTQKPNAKKSRREVHECYSVDTYRQAIHRACNHAGISVWGPHRLRHNAATEIQKKHGAEMARIILGHKHLRVTEVYAQIDETAAKKLMERIG